MSQQATESVLGRLICDDEFRRAFYQDPTAALARFGLSVTDIELDSLRLVSRATVEGFACSVDDRIRRADEGTRG